MLDLSKYQSIGEALRDALDQYANEVCLMEADRDREKEAPDLSRFQGTSAPVGQSFAGMAASPLAIAPHRHDESVEWLISAYAIFYSGGVLVPLDYKLTPDNNGVAEAFGATVLHGISDWLQQLRLPRRRCGTCDGAVTEATATATPGAERWEIFGGNREPYSVCATPRTRPALSTLPNGVAALKAACDDENI